MSGHGELVVGGVLIAPFALYVIEAAALLVVVRPLLRLSGVENAVGHPPLLVLCVYVALLTMLVILQ